MKKFLALALTLALALALSMLTACNSGSPANESTTTGNSQSESTSDGGNAPESTQPVTPARDVEIPDEILDVMDDSIYYVIIDGVEYNLMEVTVQDFLDAGFSFRDSADINQRIEPGKVNVLQRSIDRIGMYKEESNAPYFEIHPYNPTGNIVPLKDCRIDGITISHQMADISIVCNVTLRCSAEEVAAIFGEKDDIYGYWYDNADTMGMSYDRRFFFEIPSSGVNIIVIDW